MHPPEASPSGRRRETAQRVAAGLGLAALCFMVFRAGLGGPLVLDDASQLGEMLELSPLAPHEWAGFIWSESGPLGRPVAMLSFLLSSWLSGPDLWWWKAANLAAHLVAGFAAFGMVRAVARATGQDAAQAERTALVVAGLWLVHPLQVSTVLYTVQRMSELAALFVFAGLWVYAEGRSRQCAGREGRPLIASAFLLFLPLAALSHENGLLLPLLAVLVELFVFRGVSMSREIRYGFMATVALPAVLWTGVLLAGGRLALFHETATIGVIAAWERLLTQSRVLWDYLAQLLLPSLDRMGLHHDDVLASQGLLDPPTASIALLGHIGLIALAWALRRRAPLVGLGIALFFGGHALESSILALEPMYEHRNYLPALGVVLAVVAAFVEFVQRPRWLRPALAVAALAGSALLTQAHAQRWSSQEALDAYAASTHPSSPRVLASAADAAGRAGRYDEALALLAKSSAAGAQVQAAQLRCRRDGKLGAEDLEALHQTIEQQMDRYVVTRLVALAEAGLDGSCEPDHATLRLLLAYAQFDPARIASDRYEFAILRATYAQYDGDPFEAFQALTEAEVARPRSPVPALLAARFAAEFGDGAAARMELARASRIADPSSRRYASWFRDAERAAAGAP